MIVSEWAARCPSCRADVSQLPLLPAPPAVSEPLPDGYPTPLPGDGTTSPAGPVPASPSRRWRLAAGVAAGLAAVLVVGLTTSGTGGRTAADATGAPGRNGVSPVPPGPATGSVLPESLRSSVVVYTDAPEPISVAPGTPVTTATRTVARGALAGSQPVPAGPHHAVALGTGVRGGWAVLLDAPGAGMQTEVEQIAPADLVFPGAGSSVGIGRIAGDVTTVQVVTVGAAAGSPTFTVGAPRVLPAGARPAAVMADGSLAVRTERNELAVVGPDGLGPSLGQLGAVLGVWGSTVAWTSATDCTANGACPLNLTDAALGATRPVPPPVGTDGFAAGGAFSPDGAMVLVFAVAPSSPGAALLSLTPVLIDTAKARVDRGLPSVETRSVQGVPVGVAWWTADGTWTVYSGLAGSVSAAGLAGRVLDLGLPPSFAFALL
ncbi:hypothetical protein K6U06_13905 [Acidiferrimicrobium sp. IK]|uniref:hypothetical protein n=1 Tax=Acidiferrimicrobium sp. IK TaxID=2871700 RepID=UPI0021CB81C5|nr:hypothetical protein [Acidiferrimicrobium sp. IK]MCU4185463.1 hypothetical protein [Acidiferrimicrobium sp. IK]